MSADHDISQNSRKAKHHGPDARLSHRNRRETGLISYHHAVLRHLTAYFALGGVIVGLRPTTKIDVSHIGADHEDEPDVEPHDVSVCGMGGSGDRARVYGP
jgi:hypothetical protein